MYLTEFQEQLSLYEMSKKGELRFGHFSAFLNIGPFFGLCLGTAVKKVAPGIYLNFCYQSKNPSVNISVPKMRFSKMYIFGDPY